ncbi:unnamed protein product [Rhizophagus irregularis]|nr:unnamed protein product [Rhizophagus irregularis]
MPPTPTTLTADTDMSSPSSLTPTSSTPTSPIDMPTTRSHNNFKPCMRILTTFTTPPPAPPPAPPQPPPQPPRNPSTYVEEYSLFPGLEEIEMQFPLQFPLNNHY